MVALALNYFLDQFVLFFLLDSLTSLLISRLGPTPRVDNARRDQDLTSANSFFRLAVLHLGSFLLNLDDVKTVLALNHVAHLARLQRERGLFKFGHHLPAPEPSQLSAFVFAARIG